MPSLPPSPKRALAGMVTAALTATAAPTLARDGHVILIPGIWDTARTMRAMDARLRAAGLNSVIAELSPNTGRVGLDELAAQVDRVVRTRVPPGERFSLVGFSMGGLVARSYLRQFGDPRRVETFISISSPHRGTLAAWLLGSAGVRDMRPGSPFLCALDADAPRFHATRWITMRTPLDLMILPSDSSVLKWARNEVIPVPLHALMVTDRRVIARVLAELQEPESRSR